LFIKLLSIKKFSIKLIFLHNKNVNSIVSDLYILSSFTFIEQFLKKAGLLNSIKLSLLIIHCERLFLSIIKLLYKNTKVGFNALGLVPTHDEFLNGEYIIEVKKV
jgi:hypothetical protein